MAVCAQMNKMANSELYENLEIIDKGIYKNFRRLRMKIGDI